MTLRNLMKATLILSLSMMLITVIALGGMMSFTAITFFQDRSATTSTKDISDTLQKTNGQYHLENPALLNDSNRWAILINNNGEVIWQYHAPSSLPTHFNLTDVASFTRWYLSDYPVTTWIRADGLLVLGAPPGSQWKQQLVLSTQSLSLLPFWLLGCILFMLIAVLSTSALLLHHWFRKDQKERDAARSDWINGISHDIRTPLSLVMGKASRLEADPRLPEDAKKEAAIICNQSKTIRDLVGDLNLTMRLDCAMQPLRREPLQPEMIVRQAAADFLNSGMADGYPFDIHLPDMPLPTMNADATLLTRALTNLLYNCVRHNPPGCAIELSARIQATHCLFVVESNSPSHPQQISDGIAPDGNAAHGTGLKLVKQIAQAHGGDAYFTTGECFRCEIALPINGSLL